MRRGPRSPPRRPCTRSGGEAPPAEGRGGSGATVPPGAPMARVDVAPPAPGEARSVAGETDLLSRLLSAVLAEQHGEAFAQRVAWLHDAAADLRAGDAAAGEALVEQLRTLGDAEVQPHIRACSLQLQLGNIAEERERIRRRRAYDASGELQRESLAETAQLLA